MAPENIFYPTLGPFHATLEIRTWGADSRPYAFPRLAANCTTLADALMAAPTLANALSKIETYRHKSTPLPMVMAAMTPSSGLRALYPGMDLAPQAVVYVIPRGWSGVAEQIASADIDHMFGMSDLDGCNYRLRVGRSISLPAESAPTKLFMDLQRHTDIVSQCCQAERGFIGQFISQVVVCEDDVTFGGFFYDEAALQDHLADVEHIKSPPSDMNSTALARVQRQAALVGPNPWVYRRWPVSRDNRVAFLVQASLI